MGRISASRSTVVTGSFLIRLLLLVKTRQRRAAFSRPNTPADGFRYGRTESDPARQTGVRFSACTLVQVEPCQTPRPPDRSCFRLHKTKCSPTLATFTPGFHAVH